MVGETVEEGAALRRACSEEVAAAVMPGAVPTSRVSEGEVEEETGKTGGEERGEGVAETAAVILEDVRWGFEWALKAWGYRG